MRAGPFPGPRAARRLPRVATAGVALSVALGIASAVATHAAAAQETAPRYTHADSLRGGNGPGRAWWDVAF
jgi:hypothetical protein